jgi:hypothetical protein
MVHQSAATTTARAPTAYAGRLESKASACSAAAAAPDSVFSRASGSLAFSAALARAYAAARSACLAAAAASASRAS